MESGNGCDIAILLRFKSKIMKPSIILANRMPSGNRLVLHFMYHYMNYYYKVLSIN